VETDLYPRQFENYEQLRNYCYQVASVVGLSCIRIWGLRDDTDLQPATDCGYAFQLTNILRDLREDALNGRVYLPSEELETFGVTREMLTSGSDSEEFRALMRFQIARARELFQSAERLTPSLHEDGRKIFTAMMSIYRNLLDRIAEDPEAVLHRRVRVSSWRKVKLLTSLAFSQLVPAPTLEPAPSINPTPRPEKVRHVV
ncbi:MAG: phytoene/squalene synthase family protein, partial [Pirellulaceae bacterium]